MSVVNAYIIQVYSATLNAEVLFNGWHVFRITDPNPTSYGYKVNGWLCEGKNRLEVILEPPSAPAQQQPDFWLKMYKAEHGSKGIEEEDPPIAHFRWTPYEYPLNRDVPTSVFTFDLNVVRGFGHWGWQDAKPFMPQDRPDIEHLLVTFHRALADRNITQVLNMLRMKVEELARSVEEPLDRAMAEQEGYFQALYFDEPDWIIQDLDPSTLQLRSSAGGRLVEVVGSDGGPLLRGSAGTTEFEMSLWVSCIDGRWQIVR